MADPSVIFLVPNQGDSNEHFLAVAKDLKQNFCKRSVIFGATWNGEPSSMPTASPISSIPSGFAKDFWGSVAAADHFISLSHCGYRDGPMIGPGGEQPWGRSGETELGEDALRFWRRVGWGIGDGGRVLIGGCDTAALYGPMVAKTMSPTVFGFSSHIAAGVISEMRTYIAGYFLKGRTGANVVKC